MELQVASCMLLVVKLKKENTQTKSSVKTVLITCIFTYKSHAFLVYDCNVLEGGGDCVCIRVCVEGGGDGRERQKAIKITMPPHLFNFV